MHPRLQSSSHDAQNVLIHDIPVVDGGQVMIVKFDLLRSHAWVVSTVWAGSYVSWDKVVVVLHNHWYVFRRLS
jgi:hypothetical protein